MSLSRSDRVQEEKPNSSRLFRPPIATLILLGAIALAAAVVAAWFAGEGKITTIFHEINELQEYPPLWLEVPMVTGKFLFLPAIILLIVVWGIMKVSPQPRQWSRFAVVAILLTLTVRYLLWRSLSTLNLADPLNGVFSLGLFFLEMLMLSGGLIQLILMLNLKDRQPEGDRNSIDVFEGRFLPSVDVFIPTHSEPTFILRRTAIGCQALDYPKKTVFLLDDTQREEVQALAQELGCQYLTRADNRYAKAGNLNNALEQTHGDLIVVFDADFVPTTNFLTRTVGFFQDDRIALVQTPQTFYNADPIARNLGLENILTPEEEVFYRQIQPLRDSADSAICAGTSFVVRRSALVATGGFFTKSLSEDYFTGIRLSAQGYRLIYLNEKLSAGLAAENIAAHAVQRLRWARGTLQAFFIEANPLRIAGLRPIQRLAHLEGLLHWFTSISKVGYLLMPLAYSFLGVIPLRATPQEILFFFFPYYAVSLSTFSWLNYRSRSAILADIYSLTLAFPLALTVIQAMLNPFGKGFKVTPKGTTSDRYTFNWKLALPLVFMFVVTAVSLWRNLGMCMVMWGWEKTVPAEVAQRQIEGLSLGWLWSAYNLIMLGIALLILLDVPKPDLYEWFNLRRVVQLKIAGRTYWGITQMISEAGAEIALTRAGLPMSASGEVVPVALEIMEENLILTGAISRMSFRDDFPIVQVKFESVTLEQHRRLVKMLFCRPGQWKRRDTPGELRSLWLLLRVLMRPRILFERKIDVSAIAVSQG
jgi:cellulose synthase (UDP-forming)